MKTKQSSQLTLRDRLSRLNYLQASKLLGAKADRLLALGGSMEINMDNQVRLNNRCFCLSLPDATVTIAHSPLGSLGMAHHCLP